MPDELMRPFPFNLKAICAGCGKEARVEKLNDHLLLCVYCTDPYCDQQGLKVYYKPPMEVENPYART